MKVGKGVTGAVRYVFGQGRDPKTGELKDAVPDCLQKVGGSGVGLLGC